MKADAGEVTNKVFCSKLVGRITFFYVQTAA